jgi:hypothetical protein
MSFEPSQQEEYLKTATKILYQYKKDFDELKNSNQKLAFVRLLKELAGGGLKEAKDVSDLYWAGNLKNPLKEERKDKLLRLEELAKTPLVDELIIKIKDLTYSQMKIFLMEFTIDELLLFDEKFQKENE